MGDESNELSSVERAKEDIRTSIDSVRRSALRKRPASHLGLAMLATLLGGGPLLGLLSCARDQPAGNVLSAQSAAEGSGPRCPEPPQQFARDVMVEAQARAAALGRLGMGELRGRIDVVAKPLFEGLPNADRVAVTQMLMSLFCQNIVSSSMPEREKFDRISEFNQQIMQFVRDSPPPPGLQNSGSPAAQTLRIDKYLDRNAVRVAGRRNVTIHMLAVAGQNAEPIDGAVQRALRSRGYHIVPLFRRGFAQDGLHDELFRGSPSLAREFHLDKYCDSILLGTVRFGSPQRSLRRLFIGEAVLNLRAISPETGAVLDELEIREEGGGPDEAASTANALLRLQERVEEQLSEWSWSQSA